MDRIAIISDIHGNIPALEAVLADSRARGVDALYCLGDLAGKGPESARAVDVCRELCHAIARGNWDEFLTWDSVNPALRWHQEQLGPERLAYLGALPHTIEFVMSGRRVRLFHASQTSVHVRVHGDAPYETLLAMFDNTEFTGYDLSQPDVVGYGDIHGAYLVGLYRHHKTLFNAGSVGNPLDEPRATYAIVEGKMDSESPAPFSVQIVRVPYDIERTIEIARAMDMPELEPFAVELRTAVYRGRQ